MSLGLGVMLNMLGRNRFGGGLEACDEVIGRKITAINLDSERDQLVIEVGDKRLIMWDDGQSCCEHRYMSTDDGLDHFIGATLNGFEIMVGPEEDDGPYGDVHESEFLVMSTSLGVATFVNHNEHNGYYGGFFVKGRTEDC